MAWLVLLAIVMELIPCAKPSSGGVNIAGGKPTFQSSVHGPGVPSLAVDGDKNTDMAAGSCTHTTGGEGTTNPWWALDLQASRLLERVDLTNRAGDFGARLSNVRIGTTDVSPETTAPTPTNFDICASQDPAVGEGATQEFTCEGRGRYLVVLLEGINKMLTLCEVEVYATRTAINFDSTSNSLLVGYVMETVKGLNVIQCSLRCLENRQCGSFNLMWSDSAEIIICELNEDITEDQVTSGLTTDPQYTFYQISHVV